ncbi:uncharacterized protein [Diadema antillarum]|uniref:uncharacterized protein n=1 Tax=Diadema antillarum TaxID=105358 RepID=UPI003A8931D0
MPCVVIETSPSFVRVLANRAPSIHRQPARGSLLGRAARHNCAGYSCSCAERSLAPCTRSHETNGPTGSSKLNSHNDTSSRHNTNNATSTDKQTIADSNSILHEDTNSSHRKEIHDGHQGGNGENIGAGGGKATENAKKSSKNKKAASIQNQAMSESESNEEVEGLDMNSAFFARAASGKVKKQTTPPPKKEKKKKGRKDESESIEDMDPQILESRKLAGEYTW